ncbi:hypothetical protein CNH01500 [Cryptococcus deneoformans JEC21]|uniref:DDE Tnp4 domain-containing protein n=1 Tax=Cryptococcus deneoformans (strain JEC21 / ATCC MYA-565) TaxID=214684 RepID=Q5KCL6_CRYD1|nr:hypothetical protein CNH01500 [Cryptococcus neoformans var. neoformans JEC21]AAW45247.1 hypothetical protein CNH01500 [Cryptococcus neoformans var. neoformans JEC21]
MPRRSAKYKATARARELYRMATILNHKQLKTSLSIPYHALRTSRYLNRPKKYGQLRSRDAVARITSIHEIPDEDFRRKLHVNHTEFRKLLCLIKDHPVFVSHGPRKQANPLLQLTVALYRLGHCGCAASTFEIGEQFGVSEGTSAIWTTRVIKAILSLERNNVYWPDENERKAIDRHFEEEEDIPDGCVGIIDGFHVPFAYKPARHDAVDFFSYKGRYGFNILGICDHLKRIRYFQYGYPASAHDARIFKNCSLFEEANADAQSNREAMLQGRAVHSEMISQGEYLLADSAFPAGDWCVPLFKRRRGQNDLDRPEAKFNKKCSSARVKIEHAYGILKNRWQSLRSLRVKICNVRDEGVATCWIQACVVLHNLLIDTGDWYNQLDGDADEPDDYIDIERMQERMERVLERHREEEEDEARDARDASNLT